MNRIDIYILCLHLPPVNYCIYLYIKIEGKKIFCIKRKHFEQDECAFFLLEIKVQDFLIKLKSETGFTIIHVHIRVKSFRCLEET